MGKLRHSQDLPSLFSDETWVGKEAGSDLNRLWVHPCGPRSSYPIFQEWKPRKLNTAPDGMGGQVQIFTSPNPKNLQIGLASSRAFLNASMASGCLGAQDRFEDWNIRTRDGDLKSCWVQLASFPLSILSSLNTRHWPGAPALGWEGVPCTPPAAGSHSLVVCHTQVEY